ncbi:MAG: DNA repair protein RecN [Firmicutes bacterium]|nr:DNA repair protein RecN [Bacillota bacterium]
MLHVLEVRNLALIDNLTFYPGSGLNVITGETGAGKSMLLDALGLLLGERASSEVIRTGEESALIQAVFTRGKTVWPAALETDEIIFSREIRTSGPNVCRINGRIEPLTQLAFWGRQLVDLHGQNKQQSLLVSTTQRDLLDAYGGEELAQLKNKVFNLYQTRKKLLADLEAMGGDDAAVARQADFLRFQLEEINAAALSAEEEEDLQRKFRRLSNAQQLWERTAKVYAALYEGGYNEAIIEQLGLAEKELAAAAALDEKLSAILQQLIMAEEQITEAARELRNYQDELQLDEMELQRVSDRLETYRNIKKKYGPTLADVEQLRTQLQAELEELLNRSSKREEIEVQITLTEEALQQAARRLSQKRQETAVLLAEKINEALQSLALSGACFAISVQQEAQYGPTGCDRIEFQLAANAGEPLRSLAKTASGGEISRVMLAIKSVLAEQDAVPTLIFDEIDAGIGGLTVRNVAEKLKQLARHRQVICVTHQPLIAAAADKHFLIYKEEKGKRTVTRIKDLTLAEREVELARMLGGKDEVALQHAQKLLTEML